MTTGGPGWSDAIGYGETLGTGEGWHQVGGVTPRFSSCLLSNPAMCPVSQSGVMAREPPPLFSSTDVAEPLLGVVGGDAGSWGGCLPSHLFWALAGSRCLCSVASSAKGLVTLQGDAPPPQV